ncbi:DNA cytosine methyltransferase, partial [Desulfovibrio sp.]|uniref:DNA cytosine methyltransferase n=1 Tax=Desulfovibrio sp. TaxID=885 RepID=UPI00307BA0B6
MSQQMILPGLPSAISLRASGRGHTPCAARDGRMTAPSGQDPVPASLSAWQAKKKGTADERHLWPSFFRLISQCRPDVIFGEQVASPDGLAWLDIISSDLEAAHYACGAVDTCAAGFGAPHIRQRLYWVADADGEQLHRSWFRKSGGRAEFADGGGVIGLADTAFCGNGAFYGQPGKGVQQQQPTGGYSFSDGLGNTVGKGLEGYAGHG